MGELPQAKPGQVVNFQIKSAKDAHHNTSTFSPVISTDYLDACYLFTLLCSMHMSFLLSGLRKARACMSVRPRVGACACFTHTVFTCTEISCKGGIQKYRKAFLCMTVLNTRAQYYVCTMWEYVITLAQANPGHAPSRLGDSDKTSSPHGSHGSKDEELGLLGNGRKVHG